MKLDITMRIALVWPFGFDSSYVMPLSLGYLKSNLNNRKHDVRLIDCALRDINADSPEFRKILKEFDSELVGVSCWSPTYEEVLRVLKVAKDINPKVMTVMGGAHPTSYPDPAMRHGFVDFVFRGEAELSFPLFVDELQKKKPNWSSVKGLIYRSPKGDVIKNGMEREKDLDKIKIPDYDAMDLDTYIESGYRFNTARKHNAPVWVTRGCPYACEFCSAPLQNGRLIRKHSIEYMVKWVKRLYHEKGIRQINIIDDNFTFDIKYAKEFCRAMIALNLKNLQFGTPNGIRIQRIDKDLLELMREAKWENIVIAPESGSVRTLKLMKKNLDLSIVPQKVREIKDAGFKVHAFFIIGYPGETREDLEETVRLLRKCRFNFFFINNFQPLPGTPIYDKLVQAGKIPASLLPKNYSSGERAYVPETLKDFNFPRLVLKEYLYLVLMNPLNIPYVLKVIGPGMIVKKVFSNLKNMLTSKHRGSQDGLAS